MIRQPDVEHFLAHYAVALSDGELPAIGRHWMLPGFVATDQESFALNNADDIEIVFGEVVAINRKRDVAAARSEVLKLEPLGARLVSVDVRWQYLDAGGANVGSERIRYMLRLDDEFKPKLQVSVTLPLKA